MELLERARHGDTASVRVLLDAGADPLVRDRSGRTLLHLLPGLDHELLLARLLAAGVDVNAVDAQGHTALHAAAVRRVKLEHAGTIGRRPVEDLIGRLLNAGAVDLCGERGAPCPVGAPHDLRSRPTAAEIDRLRVAASRDDYRSMAELAWALYSTGKDRREILAECFGAAFPDEFFALADHLSLPGHPPRELQCHVWRLALPPRLGGPVPPLDTIDGGTDYYDRRVFECDPRLVPILRLRDSRTECGGFVLCYRLTELALGRPTVFGTSPLDTDGRIVRLGPSLLAVLRDYHAAVVARLETVQRLTPRHRDLDLEQLPAHAAALRLVDTLLPAGAPRVARTPLTVPFTTPVSRRILARLRSRASRADHRSMARLAWALYATGLGPVEVLSECFGVAFPDEVSVIVGAGPLHRPPGYATNLPWNLTLPPDRGGPAIAPSMTTWPAERQIFTWDPDLVPLVGLEDDQRWDHEGGGFRTVRHGGRIHCYRLSELAAGRGTVVSVPWHRWDDGELSVTPSGPSLLAVLHEHFGSLHRLNDWEFQQPSNRGAGYIDAEEVEGSRMTVAAIEALRRRHRA